MPFIFTKRIDTWRTTIDSKIKLLPDQPKQTMPAYNHEFAQQTKNKFVDTYIRIKDSNDLEFSFIFIFFHSRINVLKMNYFIYIYIYMSISIIFKQMNYVRRSVYIFSGTKAYKLNVPLNAEYRNYCTSTLIKSKRNITNCTIKRIYLSEIPLLSHPKKSITTCSNVSFLIIP